MASKFVLGSPSQEFYRELVSDIEKRNINVLSVGFAMVYQFYDAVSQNATTDRLKRSLEWINPHKRFTVVAATPLSIEDDVRRADIVYIHGGNGDTLQSYFNHFTTDQLKDMFDGVVCSGHSAGANFWADCYYSNDNQAICEGMGILPIKTFSHYQSWKFEKLFELAMHKSELPLIPLIDGDYIVI